MKHQVLGALQPTVGNTVGLTTRFSGSSPMNFFETQGGLNLREARAPVHV